MKRQGTVVGPLPHPATSPSTQEYYLAVALDDVNHCQRCQRGQGCGAIMSPLQNKQAGVTLSCRSSKTHSRGQQVVVDIDDQGHAWLGLVLGAYGLPVLGMLLTTGITSAVLPQFLASSHNEMSSWHAELGILISAFVGFGAGYIGWRQVSARAMCGVEHSLCLHSARIVD